MSNAFSRRQAIKSGFMAAIGSSFAHVVSGYEAGERSSDFTSKDPWLGFKTGIASYTFRKLSLENTIKAMQRLELHYISIKDFHLSLDSSIEERKKVIQQFRNAGIMPLSCGNITMENDEANIRRAFQYAKDCNIPTIVCSPHPGSLPVLDKMVKEYNIKLAIHNHGPEDKRFPSPYDAWKAVAPYDKRIGLCIDVGHTARANVNPAEAIIKCRDRLYDFHFKDIDTTEANGTTIQAGRGVLDLRSILESLIKIKYPYLLSIEYERSPDDVFPEVAETVGYTKGLLAGLSTRRKFSQ